MTVAIGTWADWLLVVVEERHIGQTGINRNRSDESRDPLHEAAKGGQEAVVETLLNFGAQVNAKNRGGETPLHWASLNGHHAVAETLLEKGGEVNAKAKDGRTAMHLAAWKGHTAVLEVLREGGADVDAADGKGVTPLHKAASLGHLLAIFMLMNFGASTYKKDNCGRTPQDLMPRSFSTESCGMELFQSASMVIDCIGQTLLLPLSPLVFKVVHHGQCHGFFYIMRHNILMHLSVEY
ncbi:26S proteasome non-ATPase regulatory subunit 10-like isoform X2 [Penaeus japonicus]|uniref:26S proteasome non-ATPase regulatory subunit 10-like isoform X2 n=1 Tax=Penaeus japonicus TaxID=27405 RepID=UPI001C7119CE|nr:26S proteasome non-ATPase regulatory subunit 10-like isoform X2 [Penaeus japonicus]